MAKVAKKILAMLLGDKKGRKFLGYVIGIAIFIVLLPFIAIYGLFGWMSGGVETLVDYDSLYEYMPSEYHEQFEANAEQLTEIERVFQDNGLSKVDISKGKTIYLSCLVGKETETDFYQKFAACFLKEDEQVDILNEVSSAFGVEFSEDDRQQFVSLYGGTE